MYLGIYIYNFFWKKKYSRCATKNKHAPVPVRLFLLRTGDGAPENIQRTGGGALENFQHTIDDDSVRSVVC